jgi:hypothetical protein
VERSLAEAEALPPLLAQVPSWERLLGPRKLLVDIAEWQREWAEADAQAARGEDGDPGPIPQISPRIKGDLIGHTA